MKQLVSILSKELTVVKAFEREKFKEPFVIKPFSDGSSASETAGDIKTEKKEKKPAHGMMEETYVWQNG